MRGLLKTTAVMSVATIVGIAAGFIKAKITALWLGPTGVGVLSQAATFVQSAETICGLGIGLGITKYVSQAVGSKDSRAVYGVFRTAWMMLAVSSVVFMLFILIFSKQVALFIFDSERYSRVLISISLSVFFTTLIVAIESFVLGLRKTDVFSKSRVVYYLLGLLCLAVSVCFYGLNGALFSIPLVALLSFFVVLLFIWKDIGPKFRDAFLGGPDKHYFVRLLKYGGVIIVTSSFTWLTFLYIRSVLGHLPDGMRLNGYYQVVFALVSYYSPFFTNSLWGYLFPTLSAHSDMTVFCADLNRAIRFITVFAVPVVSLLFLVRELFVVIVFSKEFMPCLELFPLYLGGSVLYLFSYIFGTALLSQGRLKIYFFVNIAQNIVFAVAFTSMCQVFDLTAISLSYFIMNALGAFGLLFYYIFRMGFRFSRENLKALLLGGVFMGVIFIAKDSNPMVYSFKLSMIIMWFLLVLSKDEKKFALTFLKLKKQ